MRQMLPQLYAAHRRHFFGAVGDLAPHYRAARCVIAPMVSGRGISIKTIEALALGLPFVGTAAAFRGMPPEVLSPTGLQAYDEPEAFAQAIRTALDNGAEPGEFGHAVYRRFFSRPAHFAALDEAVRLARQAASA
jgi:glycosyltransferase involved in cell wall biosynthesis